MAKQIVYGDQAFEPRSLDTRPRSRRVDQGAVVLFDGTCAFCEGAVKFIATLTDAIQVFKTNKEKSMLVMKKYLGGASEEILRETYGYFSTRAQKFPYPSIEAIRMALDMLSDQYPQAKSVDPYEIADLSFVKQVESGGLR